MSTNQTVQILKEIRDRLDLLMSDTDEWMNYEQAAKYLGVKVSTLRKKVCDLEVPHYRDCPTVDTDGRQQGKVTFLKSELFMWRKGNRVETSKEALERMKSK